MDKDCYIQYTKSLKHNLTFAFVLRDIEAINKQVGDPLHKPKTWKSRIWNRDNKINND